MARAYRKKPVVVEAVQWTGENHAEMCEFIDPEVFEIKPKEGLIIHTLEGDHHASPGDYIIKGVNGEFYPCKPDIFAKTYEPATLTPPNEWVSVDENLPDFDVPVLVYVKDIFDNKGIINITKYTITYNLTNNWLGYENSSFKITHWMPLPAPPNRRPPEGEA